MGVAVFPAPSAGGIKSVQRGLASGSGNVTITAVDINKSFVTVFGTASSGTVAASATVNATSMSGTLVGNQATLANTQWLPSGASVLGATQSNLSGGNSGFSYTQTFNSNSTNLTGGTNNLVSAVVQGYLDNSTTLVVSGACRWEVVEFN